MLAELLRLEHYLVDTASDGHAGLRALTEAAQQALSALRAETATLLDPPA